MAKEIQHDDQIIRKVRRRVEDVLRKSNAETILSVAKMLSVKTEVTKFTNGEEEKKS